MNAHEPGHHRACLCGDVQPCACTPSPGWTAPDWWPATHGDLRLILNAITSLDRALTRKLDQIKKEVRTMGEQSQAGLAELTKDLHRLADGYVALQARNGALESENGQLRAALESADADKAAAIAAAVSAEDAGNAAAIADADAIVEAVSPEPAPEPEPEPAPVEEPPADSGDAPADGSV